MTSAMRDQDGVDEAHHGNPADVAGERGVDAVAHLVRVGAAALAHQAEHPCPHRRSVFEKEERQQHGHDQAREHLAEQNRAGTQAARQRAAVLAQRLQALVDTIAQIPLAEVERRLGELIRRLADAVLGLRAQVAELAAERGRDRGGHRSERERSGEHGERGGEPVRDPVPLQPGDDRQEQRAGEDCDDDREHDHAEMDERVDHDGHRAGDRQEAPARRARRPVPPRHRGVAVRMDAGGGCPRSDRRIIISR